jgi:protocatechuate 3,4-dioxygenase beta subunit
MGEMLLLIAVVAGASAQAATPTTDVCDGVRPLQAEPVTLAPAAEPGERLAAAGRVLDYDGRPLARAAVVAYQADESGLYNPPTSQTRTPRLRAVAVTAEDGSFAFTTIRPGSYPSRTEPAHIHLVVAAPAHRVKYVDIWFRGDPLITKAQLTRKLLPDSSTFVVTAGKTALGRGFQCDIALEGN